MQKMPGIRKFKEKKFLVIAIDKGGDEKTTYNGIRRAVYTGHANGVAEILYCTRGKIKLPGKPDDFSV